MSAVIELGTNCKVKRYNCTIIGTVQSTSRHNNRKFYNIKVNKIIGESHLECGEFISVSENEFPHIVKILGTNGNGTE